MAEQITTDDVREEWALHRAVTMSAGRAEFDAWLAAHDRQVAELAWDEGFARGHYARIVSLDEEMREANPYRADSLVTNGAGDE